MSRFKVEIPGDDWENLARFLRKKYTFDIERVSELRELEHVISEEDEKYLFISTLTSFDMGIGYIRYDCNEEISFYFETAEDMLIFQLRWL